MRDADTIVIGGGHNGLTLAASLAKAGQKVLLVEQAAMLGGRARSRGLGDRFLLPGLLHETQHLADRVVEHLELGKHGLQRDTQPPAWCSPDVDGHSVVVGQDASGVSSDDAEAYQRFQAYLGQLRPLFEPLLTSVPPDPSAGLMHLIQAGWSNRGLLQRKDLLEILRLLPMCVADWLGEWFQDQRLQAGLALPAVAGEFTGPWSPGTNALLVMQACTRGGSVVGGPAGLIEALQQACEAYKVELACGMPVEQILVEEGVARGVQIANSGRYYADRVVACCDPQVALTELLGRGVLPHDAFRRAGQIRSRGTTAKLHLGVEGTVAVHGTRHEWLRIADTIDDVERAFDAVKYEHYAARPVLDVWVPTVTQPELAPPGHDLLSVMVHFAPRDLAGGWDGAQREALADAAIARLQEHMPDLSDRVVCRELLSPLDLEVGWGLTGGHLDHGERGIDQLLVRPTLECARYATPVPGLYLASSGCFPGGGLTGVPGLLASERILGDS